jgi:comEA protein
MNLKRSLSVSLAVLIGCLWLFALLPQAGAADSSKQVDINKATAEELTQLPRIGPRIAERIVQYRQEHGPFKTVEDLKAVKGIGTKLLESLRPMITVTPK